MPPCGPAEAAHESGGPSPRAQASPTLTLTLNPDPDPHPNPHPNPNPNQDEQRASERVAWLERALGALDDGQADELELQVGAKLSLIHI